MRMRCTAHGNQFTQTTDHRRQTTDGHTLKLSYYLKWFFQTLGTWHWFGPLIHHFWCYLRSTITQDNDPFDSFLSCSRVSQMWVLCLSLNAKKWKWMTCSSCNKTWPSLGYHLLVYLDYLVERGKGKKIFMCARLFSKKRFSIDHPIQTKRKLFRK